MKIARPWGVSVYGMASVKAAPDLVRVRVGLETVEPTPGEAFQSGQTKITALREVLRRHQIADAAVSASQLRLSTAYSYGGDEGRRLIGYQCDASFTIETDRMEILQSLLIDIVNAGVTRVDEMAFDTRNKPELRAQARRKAVRAAREKAELYAEAAAVTLGPVIHIEDVDPERETPQRSRSHSSASSSTAAEDLAPARSSSQPLSSSASPSTADRNQQDPRSCVLAKAPWNASPTLLPRPRSASAELSETSQTAARPGYFRVGAHNWWSIRAFCAFIVVRSGAEPSPVVSTTTTRRPSALTPFLVV
jgi:uncharacterized protein YggE